MAIFNSAAMQADGLRLIYAVTAYDGAKISHRFASLHAMTA